MKFSSLHVFLTSASLTAMLSAPGSAGTYTYTYVGSWRVADAAAPIWNCCPPTGPLAYTGQEAAALIFGGDPSDYAISTAGEESSDVNFMAWYSVIGVGTLEAAQDYDSKYLGLYYGPTVGFDFSPDNAASAFVRDGNPPGFNFAFLRMLLEYDLTSFSVLANDSAVMLVQQQFAIGQSMSRGNFSEAGQTVMSVHAGANNTDQNPTTVGARTTSLAALSFGHGVSDTFTVGGTISVNGTSLKNSAFDMKPGFGAAIWGLYSEGGGELTGLQLSGALGYMRNKGKVSRGRISADPALATGQSTIETRAINATLGYGFQQGDWLVTPSLGVTYYDTRRSAYSESGATFSASYDEMRTYRTVATLGVTGDFAVSERGRLELGVGVDYEVAPEAPRLTGTSNIPGLATFDIGSTLKPNRTQLFATLGYAHDIGNGSTISGDLRVGQAVYGTTPSVGIGVTYSMRF